MLSPVLAYWLVQMLSFVTGNLDRRGGNLYSFGFYPAAKAGRVDPKREVFFDSPYGKMRRIRGSLPGNLLADEILSGTPRVRALVCVAGNPLLSVGGGERLRKAFEQLDLLVVIDLYRNATGELAHYVLPSTDMFERPDINITGLGMQYRPYVQYTDAVVAARDERKPEWWILGRIEQELGFKSVLDAGESPDLFGRIGHMLKSRGHSLEELRASPHGIQFGELEAGRFYDARRQSRLLPGAVRGRPRARGSDLPRARGGARRSAEVDHAPRRVDAQQLVPQRREDEAPRAARESAAHQPGGRAALGARRWRARHLSQPARRARGDARLRRGADARRRLDDARLGPREDGHARRAEEPRRERQRALAERTGQLRAAQQSGAHDGDTGRGERGRGVMLAPHPWSRGFAWTPRAGPLVRLARDEADHYDANGSFLPIPKPLLPALPAPVLLPLRAGNTPHVRKAYVVQCCEERAVHWRGDPSRPPPEKYEPEAELPDARQWRLSL
jgi:hypothetical protein